MDKQTTDTAEYREAPTPVPRLPKGELVLATLVGFDANGQPQLRFSIMGEVHTLSATPTVSVHHEHLGRQAVLMFAGGDIQVPLLLGLVHSALDSTLEQPVAAPDLQEVPEGGGDVELFPTLGPARQQPLEADVDGKRLVIEADQQLVLRCGEASITLTNAGKIILRGKHLVSRSSGVNRILGGSIQMN